MDSQDGFWTWIESLSRSLGWEDRALDTREGHVGDDNGAHHVLPGWGKHPDQYVESPAGDELESAHESGERPKSLVGTTTSGQRVYFDPDLPQAHLANAHLTITGESGSGKTQAMKTILADLKGQGVPALVLDFKDDYAEKEYAAKEGFTVYDPTRRPLPFNPLEPMVDRESGESNRTFHTYQLVEILGRIYHLGELQQHALREAIKSAYLQSDDVTPTFNEVRVHLEAGKGNAELLGHLAPIFDFGFFADPDPVGFAKIVGGNTVIRLAQLPGSEVKNSVAEFFLMALYNYLVRLEQTHLLRQVLVLDEAWRVVNSPFLEPLMREARAFGLGVFVATQFPTDLPLVVSGSAATAIYFSQSNPDQVLEVERSILGGTGGGSEAMRLGTTIRAMIPLQCLVHNRHYDPYSVVDARPYYARSHVEAARMAAIVDAAGVDQSLMGELPRNSGRSNFNMTKGASFGVAVKSRQCAECSGSGDSQYGDGKPCRPCGGSGSVEWGGRSHDYEPDDESVNFFDFEDEMPWEGPKRVQWHNDMLDILHKDHGIEVGDLKVDPGKWDKCYSCKGKGCQYCKNSGLSSSVDQEPDYSEVANRLHGKGLDTYDSDTRFEVYNGKARCDEEECHDEPAKTSKVAGTPGDWQIDQNGHLYSLYQTEEKQAPLCGSPVSLCRACEGSGRSWPGRVPCYKCKGSGLGTTIDPSDWDALQTPEWGEDLREHASDYGIKPCEDCFSKVKTSKVAQEKLPGDDGPLLCTRCQAGTDNADKVCDDCKVLVDSLVDSEEVSLEERIDQRKNQAEHLDTATPSEYWNAGGWKATKQAEMQKFPPGEDDEEDNPFSPFSTSEWQMVKGPKHRR